MKRARIILSLIALVAIVSGASAFKAKSAYNTTIYTGSSSTSCPTLTLAKTVASGTAKVYWSTSATATSCSFDYTIADAN